MIKKSHSGMILITTIIMLSILATLILTQMQAVILYYKSINQLMIKDKLLYDLEAAANSLLKNNLWTKTCSIDALDPNVVLQQLAKKQGCQLRQGDRIIYYLIEDLGLFPCLQIHDRENNHSTKHIRLSFWVNDSLSLFLQLRLASSVQLLPCEQELISYIKPGLQSWRFFERSIE